VTRVHRFSPVLTLIAIELAWCLYLAFTRTIPAGHDGFQYFYLKYYFFNAYVTHGELAQWLPYVTHGSPAEWLYVVQSGIFDPLVMVAARLLSVRNFLPIFYVLICLDQVLLIVGTWLLTGEHMRARAARFAVTAAVTLSAVWFTQVWWNFHVIVAMPLMLFFVHRALADFAWRWPIGLSLLLFLQTFGNLSYVLPVTGLALAAYAVTLITTEEVRVAFRRSFHLSPAGLLMVIGVNAAFLIDLIWLRGASRNMAYVRSARGPDGAVSLDTFLNHGGYTDLRAWNAIFTGLTPQLDFTFFAGFVIAGLIVLAAVRRPTTNAQRLFAWQTVVITLLATASPLATVAYYFWPLTSLFRHLGLLWPVVRLYAVLLAGATLDACLSVARPPRFPTGAAVLMAVVLGACGSLLAIFALYPDAFRAYLVAMTTAELPSLASYAERVGTAGLLRSLLFLTVSLIVLLALVAAQSMTLRARLGWIAAAVLMLDVATYAAAEQRMRTLRPSVREAGIFRFAPLPYVDQRVENARDVRDGRRALFSKSAAQLIEVRYFSEDLLWFVDGYQTTNKTVYWPTGLDALLRARTRDDVESLIGDEEVLALPIGDRVLARAGGLQQSKVRTFAQAIVCPDVQSTARVIESPLYGTQVALLTSPDRSPFNGISILPCDPAALEALPIQPATARITPAMFRSNRVDFDVQNDGSTPLVMTYSDGWSERWHARVAGADARLFRSDLGYKAVVVPPGASRVQFTYVDPWMIGVFALHGGADVVFAAGLAWMLLRRISERPDARATPAAIGSWSSTI